MRESSLDGISSQDRRRTEQTYRDHHMAVEAIRTRTGWRWSYLIDGRVQSVNKLSLTPSAESALRQGAAAARARVDELTRAGWR